MHCMRKLPLCPIDECVDGARWYFVFKWMWMCSYDSVIWKFYASGVIDLDSMISLVLNRIFEIPVWTFIQLDFAMEIHSKTFYCILEWNTLYRMLQSV